MGDHAADVERIVTGLVEGLRRRSVRVEQVVLFGSRARGQGAPDSDIDLLVVSPDFGRDVLADYAAIYSSLPQHAVDVDALPCTPADVASPEPDDFLAIALEDGVVVYRREDVARTRGPIR